MYLTLADLGQQSTNMIQASNAYSKGRMSLSQGNMRIAQLSLAELQFTYNNAKNAGNDSEATEIYRLYNYLKDAISPPATPSAPPPPPSSFSIDMSVTKTSGSSGGSPSPVPFPGMPGPSYSPVPQAPSGPNWLLIGGVSVGVLGLVGIGAWALNRNKVPSHRPSAFPLPA